MYRCNLGRALVEGARAQFVVKIAFVNECSEWLHHSLLSMATPTNARGGYEYEFVTTPPDWLVCNICHYPSREPYLSGCCGHTFCKSCLEAANKATAITDACPMCRAEEYSTIANKQAVRTIKSLHVFCINKKEGCGWQGEVNNIIGHLEDSTGCKFQEVLCPNNCLKVLQRQHLAKHVEYECVRRKVICKYCHITDEKQFIEGEHKKQCPKLPVACPNKCEVVSVPRSDNEEHLKMCPLESIQCEYYIVGCKERMARKDKERHEEEMVKEHLSLTKEELSVMKQELSDTKEKLSVAQQEAKKVRDELTEKIAKRDQDLDIVKQQLECSAEALAKLEANFQAKMSEIASIAQERITELETKLEHNITTTSLLVGNWHTLIHTAARKPPSVVPVIVKVSPYSKNDKYSISWYSCAFYTHPNGYEMCLFVYTSGHYCHALSLCVYLMKGSHDDKLQWPLKGKCEVKLLNQISNSEHYCRVSFCQDISRVVSKKKLIVFHNSTFITFDKLDKVTTTCQYLKDDSIFFQVNFKLN